MKSELQLTKLEDIPEKDLQPQDPGRHHADSLSRESKVPEDALSVHRGSHKRRMGSVSLGMDYRALPSVEQSVITVFFRDLLPSLHIFTHVLSCPPTLFLYLTLPYDALHFFFFFVLYDFCSAVSPASWVAVPNWETVLACDTQGQQLLFPHQVLSVLIFPGATVHSPCFWN